MDIETLGVNAVKEKTNFKIFPSFSQMIWSFSCNPKVFLIN